MQPDRPSVGTVSVEMLNELKYFLINFIKGETDTPKAGTQRIL